MTPTPECRAVIAALAMAWFAGAADLPKAAVILEENSLRCDNQSVRMSGLSLASAADAGKGGLHGPHRAREPDESMVMRMISGEKPKIPSESPPPTGAQVAEIRSWIEQGAPWPEELRADGKPDRKNIAVWSLQPLKKAPVPRMGSRWVRTPIFSFSLASMNVSKNHGEKAAGMDKPAAALIKHLKSRGLLDDTIVFRTTEFGRMPCSQGAKGRDYNPFAFTVWLAGGGIIGVVSYGVHATVLRLLGIDHTKLPYRHNRIDRRLTDVHGQLIPELLG